MQCVDRNLFSFDRTQAYYPHYLPPTVVAKYAIGFQNVYLCSVVWTSNRYSTLWVEWLHPKCFGNSARAPTILQRILKKFPSTQKAYYYRFFGGPCRCMKCDVLSPQNTIILLLAQELPCTPWYCNFFKTSWSLLFGSVSNNFWY